MNSTSRRKFIRNTALGAVAMSAGSFAFAENRKYFNAAQLFKGGVRFADIENLLANDFPHIFKDIIFVKVKCKPQDNIHTSLENEFLKNIELLKVKHHNLKINTMFSKSFDVAHYNYQEYMGLLKVELKSIAEFIEKNNLDKTKLVNLFVTSDIGRNNYFNDLNEIQELSGLDHDGEGSDETFAMFYTNSRKIKTGNFSNTIVLQEDLFSYFEQLLGNFNSTDSNKNIFELMA